MSVFTAFFEASQTHKFVLNDLTCPALIGRLVNDSPSKLQSWALHLIMRTVTIRFPQISLIAQVAVEAIASCWWIGRIIFAYFGCTEHMKIVTIYTAMPFCIATSSLRCKFFKLVSVIARAMVVLQTLRFQGQARMAVSMLAVTLIRIIYWFILAYSACAVCMKIWSVFFVVMPFSIATRPKWVLLVNAIPLALTNERIAFCRNNICFVAFLMAYVKAFFAHEFLTDYHAGLTLVSCLWNDTISVLFECTTMTTSYRRVRHWVSWASKWKSFMITWPPVIPWTRVVHIISKLKIMPLAPAIIFAWRRSTVPLHCSWTLMTCRSYPSVIAIVLQMRRRSFWVGRLVTSACKIILRILTAFWRCFFFIRFVFEELNFDLFDALPSRFLAFLLVLWSSSSLVRWLGKWFFWEAFAQLPLNITFSCISDWFTNNFSFLFFLFSALCLVNFLSRT